MKILLSFLLLALSTAVLSVEDDGTSTTSGVTPDVTTSTVPPETTSTVPPETTSSTVPPETTTSSAVPPETTTSSTVPPETTTSSTVAPETTTSTVPPETTSTAAPKTTAVPQPDICSWNITRKNVTCIRAKLKAHFIIPLQGNDTQIELGCGADSEGSDCSNDTQTLVLVERNYYTFTMIFEKDGNKVFVRNITFDYTLPSGEKGAVANNDKHFVVSAGNSYLCRSETKVKLENVTMDIVDIQVQAFGEKDNKDFGSVEECEADDKVSDVVPIAVGIALASLIIIVLIAYLVGRRRSRQKGYQSV